MERKIIFSVGEFYHIYNRGTEKRDIFLNANDHQRFLKLLLLSNGSRPVVLKDIPQGFPLGNVVGTTTIDTTPEISLCSGWCGGTSSGTSTSMERKDPTISGAGSSNWGSNNTFTKNGLDSASGAINGTPKSQNSINLRSIGYYCDPYTQSYEEGGYYLHAGEPCYYLSSSLSGGRYGDIYRGTVASSTQINGHSLSANPNSLQFNDNITNPIDGEDIFVAIYQIPNTNNASVVTAFRNYFKTGANPPPHLNYGIIRFKYGTAP